MNIPAALQNLINSEFRFAEEYLFLNHAAVSPWPQRTADAVERFAKEKGLSDDEIGAVQAIAMGVAAGRIRAQFRQVRADMRDA